MVGEKERESKRERERGQAGSDRDCITSYAGGNEHHGVVQRGRGQVVYIMLVSGSTTIVKTNTHTHTQAHHTHPY